LDQKKVSSSELTRAFLKRISSHDSKLNAFITVTEDMAAMQADVADQRISKEDNVTPLTGIPLAIKDVILVKGVRNTAGSKFLTDFVAPYDSTVTTRLKKSGAVFLGKTNCDEFAMGSSNENSAYGVVRNPWNQKCVPGGSSGGSAACVAAIEAPASLGTDTGGSIRQPAALCGIAGLKTTYGRVSRYGVVAFGSSLDQVGPMARRVEDVAFLYETIAGYDPLDSTSVNLPVTDATQTLDQPIRGIRIGYPKEYVPDYLSSEVKENFFAALKIFESLGATVEEVSLPHTDYGIACYYIVAPAEASANLARYDGVRYTTRSLESASLSKLYAKSRTAGFGSEVRRRIMLGTFVLSSGYYDAYYRKAQQVRTLLRKDFSDAFSKVDILVTPTSPTPAFEIGSKSNNPLEMYLSDVFTVSISMAGLPGLAVPSGFTSKRLPLGIQIVGKPFDEARLLRAGHQYEQQTQFFKEEPPL
jgi:aspartyl-tRNA(Asn)/glutamyl-tRNA(Gln) amidotransferase subunit A